MSSADPMGPDGPIDPDRPGALSGGVSRRSALLGLVGAALALGGCQVRPLYAEIGAGPGGVTVMDDLKKVSIPVTNARLDQVLRNELIYQFTGGGEPSKPVYTLRIIVTTIQSSVAVQVMSQVPASYILTLTANFQLYRNDNRQTLLTGVSTADASFDYSSQRFANLRAKQDAEDRAAKVVANDLRIRLAAFFATHPGGAGATPVPLPVAPTPVEPIPPTALAPGRQGS